MEDKNEPLSNSCLFKRFLYGKNLNQNNVCFCSFVFPVDPQEALNNCLKVAESVPDSSASSDYEASCYSSLGESADLCV